MSDLFCVCGGPKPPCCVPSMQVRKTYHRQMMGWSVRSLRDVFDRAFVNEAVRQVVWRMGASVRLCIPRGGIHIYAQHDGIFCLYWAR